MTSPRLLVLALCLGYSLSVRAEEAGWRPLSNGRDLSGWETYLGPNYNLATKKFEGPPVGLNRDPEDMFTIVEVDGEPALRVGGRQWGGVSTVEVFENYHLRLQFKWGAAKYPPKDRTVRDSGLLYHAVGPHAGDGRFWMRSQEFQIQEGDTGDYWAVGGTRVAVRTRREGSDDKPQFLFDPAGVLREFRAGGEAGRRVWKSPDAERPSGEWNTLDLYCLGATSYHVVNGVVVMVLRESTEPDAAGGWRPLTRGRIQLQSEGAEVFFRAIQIRPIERLPTLAVRL